MVTKSKISLISILFIFFLVVIVVANSVFGVGGLTKASWLRSQQSYIIGEVNDAIWTVVVQPW